MTTYIAPPKARPIHCIANEIFSEYARLNLAVSDYVAAYLEPLGCINDIRENFGYDKAVDIAAYCLDGLSLEPGWTSASAHRLTRELRSHVAAVYGEGFDALRFDEGD